MKTIEDLLQQWYDQNAPIGKLLGYPECCINAFCDQPPVTLRASVPTQSDIDRFAAGCIDGFFTGFIPCAYHAGQVLSGRVSLESLIKNRNPAFPPFPFYF